MAATVSEDWQGAGCDEGTRDDEKHENEAEEQQLAGWQQQQQQKDDDDGDERDGGEEEEEEEEQDHDVVILLVVDPADAANSDWSLNEGNKLQAAEAGRERGQVAQFVARKSRLICHSSFFQGIFSGGFREASSPCIQISWPPSTFALLLSLISEEHEGINSEIVGRSSSRGGGSSSSSSSGRSSKRSSSWEVKGEGEERQLLPLSCVEVTEDTLIPLLKGAAFFGIEIAVARCNHWARALLTSWMTSSPSPSPSPSPSFLPWPPHFSLPFLVEAWQAAEEAAAASDVLRLLLFTLCSNFDHYASAHLFPLLPFSLLSSALLSPSLLACKSELSLASAISRWCLQNRGRQQEAAEKAEAAEAAAAAGQEVESSTQASLLWSCVHSSLLPPCSPHASQVPPSSPIFPPRLRLTPFSQELDLSCLTSLSADVITASISSSEPIDPSFPLPPTLSPSLLPPPATSSNLKTGSGSDTSHDDPKQPCQGAKRLHLPVLSTLNISSLPAGASQAALENLLERCPNLESLIADDAPSVAPSVPLFFSPPLTNLRRLSLALPVESTEDFFLRPACPAPLHPPFSSYRRYSSLHSLSLKGRHEISDNFLLSLPPLCPRLLSLNISHCSSLSDKGMAKFLNLISNNLSEESKYKGKGRGGDGISAACSPSSLPSSLPLSPSSSLPLISLAASFTNFSLSSLSAMLEMWGEGRGWGREGGEGDERGGDGRSVSSPEKSERVERGCEKNVSQGCCCCCSSCSWEDVSLRDEGQERHEGQQQQQEEEEEEEASKGSWQAEEGNPPCSTPCSGCGRGATASSASSLRLTCLSLDGCDVDPLSMSHLLSSPHVSLHHLSLSHCTTINDATFPLSHPLPPSYASLHRLNLQDTAVSLQCTSSLFPLCPLLSEFNIRGCKPCLSPPLPSSLLPSPPLPPSPLPSKPPTSHAPPTSAALPPPQRSQATRDEATPCKLRSLQASWGFDDITLSSFLKGTAGAEVAGKGKNIGCPHRDGCLSSAALFSSSVALSRSPPRLSSLQHLTVGMGGSLTDHGCSMVADACCQLRVLNLNFQPVSEEGLLHILHGCPLLSSLSLSHCNGHFSPTFILSLPHSPYSPPLSPHHPPQSHSPLALTTLKLHGAFISWLAIDHLRHLASAAPSLRHLSLRDCPNLGPGYFEAISQSWPGLRSLALHECGRFHKTSCLHLKSLHELSRLTSLTLIHCGVILQEDFIANVDKKLALLRHVTLDLCDAHEGRFPESVAFENLAFLKIKRCKSMKQLTVKSFCALDNHKISSSKQTKDVIVVVRNPVRANENLSRVINICK